MKLYFTLPNFFENFDLYIQLFTLNKKHPDWFKEEVVFEHQTGNFPYVSWNGGYNNFAILPKAPLYRDFVTYNENAIIPTIFNCSNICLTEEDYSDTVSNIILSSGNSGSNKIEISDLKLYEYLIDKYPEYDYVLSSEIFLFNPEQYTPEFLNYMLDTKFSMAFIPDRLSCDLEFLSKIKKKDKVLLCINPIKCCSCENFLNCKQNVHAQQVNYSQYDQFLVCPQKDQFYPIYLSTKKYNELGFSHFYFSNYYFEKIPYNYFLANFFIKEEYMKDALEELL